MFEFSHLMIEVRADDDNRIIGFAEVPSAKCIPDMAIRVPGTNQCILLLWWHRVRHVRYDMRDAMRELGWELTDCSNTLRDGSVVWAVSQDRLMAMQNGVPIEHMLLIPGFVPAAAHEDPHREDVIAGYNLSIASEGGTRPSPACDLDDENRPEGIRDLLMELETDDPEKTASV